MGEEQSLLWECFAERNEVHMLGGSSRDHMVRKVSSRRRPHMVELHGTCSFEGDGCREEWIPIKLRRQGSTNLSQEPPYERELLA